jgi:predicted PurR-regulated permease PerM
MNEKVIENIFFFGLFAFVAYLTWLLLVPFLPSLVLAAIIATSCYPLYRRILHIVPTKGAGLPALLTTLLVFILIIGPLAGLGYLLFTEAASFYGEVSSGRSISVAPTLTFAQDLLNTYVPNANIDIAAYASDGAGWLVKSMGSVFASTANVIGILGIAFIGLYYLFKDGEQLIKKLISLSPLPNKADEKIINRLASAVRSVLAGSLAVGLIQGVLTAIGFTIFGVPEAILWGTVTAVAALVPMVGTALVFIPTVAYLVISEAYTSAIGVAVWGVVFVGLVDNFVGPYLMSRGATLHPFLVLISAIGGITVFGPIGFILGPVIMSFLIALIEIYEIHIIDKRSS